MTGFEPNMSQLTGDDIKRLLELLDQELAELGVTGELYLVGGAVMCLVFDARESTHDVDAFFKPTRIIREAARRVAARVGIEDRWLNDAVKGYLSDRGDFDTYLDLPNLRVLTSSSSYLLAMKCLAARIGEEFHDVSDIRYLLRDLNIESYDDAVELITRYYPIERFPQKTLYLLEELLSADTGSP